MGRSGSFSEENKYFEVEKQTDNQNKKGHSVIKVQNTSKSSKKAIFTVKGTNPGCISV